MQPPWSLPIFKDGQIGAAPGSMAESKLVPLQSLLSPRRPRTGPTDHCPRPSSLCSPQFLTTRTLLEAENGFLFNHNVKLGLQQRALGVWGLPCEAAGRGTRRGRYGVEGSRFGKSAPAPQHHGPLPEYALGPRLPSGSPGDPLLLQSQLFLLSLRIGLPRDLPAR